MRFAPIPPEQWTDAQRQVAAAIVSSPRGELRGPFVPLLYSPRLAQQVQALGEYIRFGSAIPDGLLEVAILMTARKRECPHIWASHSRLALKAGVTPEVISALARRALPDGDGSLAAVVAFCKELLDDNRVSDAAFERVDALWGKAGAMDLTGTCGYYGLLAMVLNVAAGPMEPGSAAFSLPV